MPVAVESRSNPLPGGLPPAREYWRDLLDQCGRLHPGGGRGSVKGLLRKQWFSMDTHPEPGQGWFKKPAFPIQAEPLVSEPSMLNHVRSSGPSPLRQPQRPLLLV